MDESKMGNLPQRSAEEELRRNLQLNKEGVSPDYYNTAVAAVECCYMIVNNDRKLSEQELRGMLSESIKEYSSYTEYLSRRGNSPGAQFLTEKGKETVKKLDELALEVKAFVGIEPSEIDVPRLYAILKKVNNVVYNRENS